MEWTSHGRDSITRTYLGLIYCYPHPVRVPVLHRSVRVVASMLCYAMLFT